MKRKFMRLARKLSEKSEYKFQVGAVIVKGNRVVGIGFNKLKTSPQSMHPWRTRHAECDAIISCGLDNTDGAVAYVYRLLKDGSGAMSKPCESCERMLKSRGIKKVYYTTDGNGWEMEKYG